MRRLLYEVTRCAPFLRSERGALHIQRTTAKASGDPTKDLDDVDARGGTVDGRDLEGASLSRWSACGATLRGIRGDRVSWSALWADGAHLVDWQITNAHLAMVSARESRLQNVELDGVRAALCDFSGATLDGVSLRGSRLDGCDFSGAVFLDVDLSEADLRGCVLRGAWLSGAKLDGARVVDADLRGAAGLGPDARADLARRGARVGGGWLYRLWGRLIGGGDPPRPERHTVVRAAVTWTWTGLAVLLPVVFFLRATLNPVNPDEPPFWEGSWEEPEEPPQD